MLETSGSHLPFDAVQLVELRLQLSLAPLRLHLRIDALQLLIAVAGNLDEVHLLVGARDLALPLVVRLHHLRLDLGQAHLHAGAVGCTRVAVKYMAKYANE